MPLVFLRYPEFPLAHALLEFWAVVDQKIYGKSHDSLKHEKLGLISAWIQHELGVRDSLSIPRPQP